MKKIVFLTGAGMSAESGIKTFRDAGGLWEEYPVMQVASHDGWLADPELVNRFYNERRKQLVSCEPNEGHRVIAELEKDFEIVVVTQNVDNLHERAGSKKVVHLHGELMKVCSSRDTENRHFWRTMTADDYEVKPGEKAGDGSLLRPYIVFFQEAVPKMEEAVVLAQNADIFVIIGTSLNVYPAAGLVQYVKPGTPVYLIDPKPSVGLAANKNLTVIAKGASEGMKELLQLLK
ncbi:MAG: NAD-dependent deacylase [Bacteroidaceae bacterium]|nr:NAD-dependent deacylase [Bacteroidaceae bacterium]